MARRGSYASVNGVRRLFRTLPDEITKEVRALVEKTATAIEADAKALAPIESGTLRKSISSKVSRDGLSAKIGIRGKRARRKAFYAHFVEFGTRAYVSRPSRSGGLGKKKSLRALPIHFYIQRQSAIKKHLLAVHAAPLKER